MTSLWISLLITSVMFNFDSVLSDEEVHVVGQGDRIFNGTAAKEGEFKFMVMVTQTWKNGTITKKWFASGFLLSPSHVMAYADYHVADYIRAVRNSNSSSQLGLGLTYDIYAGYLKSGDKEEQHRNATDKDIYLHPSKWLNAAERSFCEYHHNKSCFEWIRDQPVMIITVPESFKLEGNVATVSILKDPLTSDVRLDDGVIVGYGWFNSTKEGKVNFPTLRKATGVIGSDKVCHRDQPGMNTNGRVCFKGLGTSCGGDEAGLIVYRHKHGDVAVGVIINRPCKADAPSVGVAIDSIFEWTRYVTNNSQEVKYTLWEDIKTTCVKCNRFQAWADDTTTAPTTKKSAGSRLAASVVDIVAMTLFFLY